MSTMTIPPFTKTALDRVRVVGAHFVISHMALNSNF
jgi:hypothetical protein